MKNYRLKENINIMLHKHTIWKIMRKYTNRQIQEDSVKETSRFLEFTVKNLIEKSERLLEYNGSQNQRITKDCIKAIIKSEYDTLLPEKAGGNRKRDDILQSPNSEVM